VVLSKTTTSIDDSGLSSPSSSSSSPTGTPTTPPVCGTFTGIDQPAPTGCPGGGVPSDLHPWITVEDASGVSCGVCAAGDVTFRVELINDCAVDIDVDSTCAITGSWIGGPESASASTGDCYGTPSVTTVPAGGSVVWLEGVRSALPPGDYQGGYTLSGDLGTVEFVICLE
jgi:hypothetical protein